MVQGIALLLAQVLAKPGRVQHIMDDVVVDEKMGALYAVVFVEGFLHF
jgi:hypothetical protein